MAIKRSIRTHNAIAQVEWDTNFRQRSYCIRWNTVNRIWELRIYEGQCSPTIEKNGEMEKLFGNIIIHNKLVKWNFHFPKKQNVFMRLMFRARGSQCSCFCIHKFIGNNLKIILGKCVFLKIKVLRYQTCWKHRVPKMLEIRPIKSWKSWMWHQYLSKNMEGESWHASVNW